MTAATFRRKAELCRLAARRCTNTAMAAVWMRHHDRLITKALRIEREFGRVPA
jgi:hypothetical protein